MTQDNNNAPDYAGHSGAHTPGPWHVEPHDGYIPEEWGVEPIQVVGTDGEIIACNTAFYPTALAAKNANLIAAAPDMLEALQIMDAYLYVTAPESNERQIVNRALAIAEGRQP